MVCAWAQRAYCANATFADIKYYKGDYLNIFQREATYDEVNDDCLPPGDFPDGITQYVIFSGVANGAGNSSGARFKYVPSEEQSFLALYFSCYLVNLPDGHDPAYQYIYVYDPHGEKFGCNYYYKVNTIFPNGFGEGGGSTCGRTRTGSARKMAVMFYDLSQYVGDTITIEVLANACSNMACWSTIRLAMATLDSKQLLCANQVHSDMLFSAPDKCQSYQWHRGSMYGPVVSTERDFLMTPDKVDNYYCQIATDCGSAFYTACEVVKPVADVFIRHHCDYYEFFNKSYILKGEKKVKPDWQKWVIDDTISYTTYDISPIHFPEGSHHISLEIGSNELECVEKLDTIIDVCGCHETYLFDTICETHLPYHWKTYSLNSAGVLTDTVKNAAGCDSIIYMILHVIPAVHVDSALDVCRYELPVRWREYTIYDEGLYKSISGCDSIFTLDLTIKSCPIPDDHPLNPYLDCDTMYSTTDVMLPYSDHLDYEWFGKKYDVAGVYHDTLRGGAYNGCDSVGTLNLYTIPFPDNVIGDECMIPPMPSDFELKEVYKSDGINSMSTPMVVDIDGDGITEIVSCKWPGVCNPFLSDGFVVIDGRNGAIKGTISTVTYSTYGQPITIADINNDRKCEIMLLDMDNYAYCYSYNGALLWRSSFSLGARFIPQLCDFNHDGLPELVFGKYIFNAQSGALLHKIDSYSAYNGYGAPHGIDPNGNSKELTAYYLTALMDIDGDGQCEICAGNTIYDIYLSNFTDSVGNRSAILHQVLGLSAISEYDGQTIVVDFDNDGDLDVCVLGLSHDLRKTAPKPTVSVYVWEGQTNDIIAYYQFISSGDESSTWTGPSIPYCGDLDGDGLPEITFSIKGMGMMSFKYDASAPNHMLLRHNYAPFSETCGYTVFDFNADGKSEIVYRGAYTLSIIDGETLANLCSPIEAFSGTIAEYPVVADVNGDGVAEIVVNRAYTNWDKNTGKAEDIKGWTSVYGTAKSASWSSARSVWNQWAYTSTCINEDMTVPKFVFDPSTTFPNGNKPYNTFLSQVPIINQQGEVVIRVADVAVDNISQSFEPDSIAITLDLSNQGGLNLFAPFEISIYKNEYRGEIIWKDTIRQTLCVDSSTSLVERIPTSFLCGDQEIFKLLVAVNDNGNGIAQHGNQQSECDTTNNIGQIVLPLDFGSDTITFSSFICEKQLPYTHPETGIVFPIGSASFVDVFDTLTNQYGCDSIVHVSMTISAEMYHDSIDTICQQNLPYVWQGRLYTTSGIYTDTLVTSMGCDSVLHLYLTVLDTTTSITTYSICEGESIRWNGKTYSLAGTYRDTLVNAAGCDSLLTLHIQYKDCQDDPNNPLNPMPFIIVRDTLDTTICVGEYLDWRGIHYTDPGVYRDTGYYWFGWDSVYWVLDLKTKDCDCDTMYSDTTDVVCRTELPYLWHGKILTEAGVLKDTLVNAVGCDSIVTLTLSINEPTTSDTTAVACDSIVWHGITYTMSGDYDYQTTNAAGCDSTRTLHLTIRYASVGTNDTTVCRNDLPLLWEDSTWTDAGVKTKILTNAAGCDSVVTLTLSVNEPTAGDTAAVACSSFTWYGQTYTTSGSYTHLLTNAAGCDSTLTLQLTINQPTNGAKDTTVCADALPLLWEDSTWTAAGTKTKVLTNAVGCDSIVTLTLYVNQPTTSDTTAVACDSIVWHGITYTMSGDYDYQTTNAAGCDSTRTLHLTIRHASVGTNDTTVCRNDLPLVWEDATWTDAGVKTKILTNAAGCDSVVTLHLAVDVFSASDTAAAICRADLPYTWHGKQLHDAGTLKDTMVNSVLCDSIITLTLTVNDPTASDTTATACSSFTWHGTTYTASGDYDYQTTNANGCDSTRTLHLTINQPTTGDTTAYVCAGTDYYWHGTLANDGAQLTLTNAAGCDSVVTLHLITKPVSSYAKDTTVCAEALPIVWADSTWTEAGTKIAILTNASGCDSTITLTLHVNNHCCPDTVHNIADVNICDTLLPYTWTAAHTLTLDQAGEYSDTLRNDDGCDSILYFLTLTTYTCCAPMEATMQVPDVCADDASMDVAVTMQRGAFNAYRVHYTNAPGNAMPFRDTVINDAPADQSVPVTLTLPVPHDATDRTHYPRPDTYGIAMTLYDACGDSLHLASTTFDVLFPSWLLDQHWDDVIAILNDRYNGGYTFSDIRWLRDGEVIPGERELYIYLPHQLWTTPEEQHHDYAYQALLTRADDGKSILTCPMTPYHIDSTNVLTEPYVAVAPTIVSHENPVVHVMTNTQGTYWIYSLTGKLLRTADYEPCDHEVFDIRLFEAQTMYILVFTPRHETKPLKEKYRAVKVMVE